MGNLEEVFVTTNYGFGERSTLLNRGLAQKILVDIYFGRCLAGNIIHNSTSAICLFSDKKLALYGLGQWPSGVVEDHLPHYSYSYRVSLFNRIVPFGPSCCQRHNFSRAQYEVHHSVDFCLIKI